MLVRRGIGDATSGAAGSLVVGGPLTNFAQTVNDSDFAQCRGWAGRFNPGCWFKSASMVAPPPAPSGDVLTVPPASGEEAQATVDALLNQQLADQQALAAGQVQSSTLDQLSSAAVQAGQTLAAPFGVAWWVWALGLGAFAIVAIGGGSPRRYGR